jgi:hypothetical protein
VKPGDVWSSFYTFHVVFKNKHIVLSLGKLKSILREILTFFQVILPRFPVYT